MKAKKLLILIFSFIIITLNSCHQGNQTKDNLTKVRIGWQVPLATQGQIVQVMKNTNVLKLNGIKGDFISFSYGGPQSEAALAGELDIIFVGDQPAVNLISKGGKWKIVCRLFYTKTAIMVPINSKIMTIADLKGKTVASPFGSVAHREAILKEQFVGLDADKDVNNINLDILEISSVVQAGGESKWGNIDAVGVWEPSTSLFIQSKLARIVDFTKTLGIVAISEDFINKYPKVSIKFIESLIESWAYFSLNIDEVDKWYIEDAQLTYNPEILKSASSIEPNISAKNINDVDLFLTKEHINTLEIATKWAFDRGYTKTIANISQAINQKLLSDAIALINKEEFDINKIKVQQ